MSSSAPAKANASTHVGLAILAMAIGSFGIGSGEFSVMGLLPTLASDLAITEPQAGHVISAYALGVVVGAPLFSISLARRPRRMVLLGLMAVFAAANFASALAPGYHSLIALRFLSGLPHGAYFGLAALVAASLVPSTHRARAVGRLMMGLTVATLLGMPLAAWIGQTLGWRPAFATVGAIGVLAVALIFVFVPKVPADHRASARRELSALRNAQVWLTLGIAAIGCGGMFAVITYIVPLLTEETQIAPAYVPFVLTLFGIGMTVGNSAGAFMADKALMPTVGGMLLLNAIILATLPLTAASVTGISVSIFLVGFTCAIAAALQTRLMDVAVHGQALAATLMHAAFNLANALGAYLGGLSIAAGFGWSSTGWVGAILAMLGFGIFLVAVMLDRNRPHDWQLAGRAAS
jgi:DHA1 family inner membrane transport protein